MRTETFTRKQLGKRIEKVMALRKQVDCLDDQIHCDMELKRLRVLMCNMIISDEPVGTLVVKGWYQSDPLEGRNEKLVAEHFDNSDNSYELEQGRQRQRELRPWPSNPFPPLMGGC